MNAKPPCEHLAWDSEFFRRRIARAAATRLTPDAVRNILAWCARESVDCLYFLADSADPATAALAEDNGFRLVDVRVTLRAAVGDITGGKHAAALVRPSRPADVPALKSIARVSHRDTRFYADARFPRPRCDALYETWIARSCEGFANHVFVCDLAGEPAGYLTCHLKGGGVGQIGLVAVSDKAQGHGIGGSLLSAARDWFAGQGVRNVVVVTQGRNCKAQRFYQRAGFATESLELWYHKWFTP